MKITLQVSGREVTFSEEELIAIVEKHFEAETVEKAFTAKVAKEPTEDQWFKVDPLGIDQKLFEKKREDGQQEETRQIILQAFAEVKSNPEKYGKKFKTMMPKKTWSSKIVRELEELASKMGDHNADWVEQALEWAQRIANGESWETICNNADTANWYRLIVWKNGYARLVGGSRISFNDLPASDVGNLSYDSFYRNDYTVPLVVLYEK